MKYCENRNRRLLVSLLLTVLVSFAMPAAAPPLQVSAEAATVKLNVKKKTLYVGDTYTLKVKNAKKVKWSLSDKRVATVNSKGKVTAKKAGQSVVTAKVGSKKLKCVITVKEAAHSEADQVIEIVNREREAAGLAPLTKNSYLTAAAKVRAKELETLFSHTRPDGTSCFTAVSPQYRYRTLGENIAAGYPGAESVMKGWMNSQGHRENILSDGFREIGVAVYESGGKKYWVQIFGSSF